MAIHPAPKRFKKTPAEFVHVSATPELKCAKGLDSHHTKYNIGINDNSGWKNKCASDKIIQNSSTKGHDLAVADNSKPLQQLCCICGCKRRSSPISEKRIEVARRNYYGPQEKNLADYLDKSGPRVVTTYGITEVYPTDDARSVIQGILTSVLDMKCDGLEHKHLLHPENYILGEKRYYPYSKYVRNLATGDVLHNRKLLRNADEEYADTMEVRLVYNRKDLECDDMDALKFIIFEVILTVDGKRPLLSAEWEDFRNLFSSSNPDFAAISSHSCLWGFRKRLQIYRQLDDWCNPSKAKVEIRDLVIKALQSLPVLKTYWAKQLQKDRHLANFARNVSHSRQRNPYGLIRIFRNLVEHCQETASAASPYKNERYLDYKLRRMFPNMLEDIQRRLLHEGFVY